MFSVIQMPLADIRIMMRFYCNHLIKMFLLITHVPQRMEECKKEDNSQEDIKRRSASSMRTRRANAQRHHASRLRICNLAIELCIRPRNTISCLLYTSPSPRD